MAKPKLSETNLVRAILDYLYLRGHYCRRINSGKIFTGRHVIKLADVGTPDIIGCKNDKSGQFFAIEVKVGRNLMSNEQIDNKLQIEKCGGIHILAYSLDDVIKVGF